MKVKQRLMYVLAALLVTVIAVNGSVLANVQERIIYVSREVL